MTVASPALAADPLAAAIPFDLEAQPSHPFGSLELSCADLPVSEWAIHQAHLRLLAHYHIPATATERASAQRGIGNQLDKAHTIALNPARWAIHTDYVTIIGSHGDPYRVTPAFCEGAAWSAKSGRTSTMCKGSLRAAVGMCTHQLAVEYLRLAQALETPQLARVPTDDSAPIAYGVPALTQIAQAEILGAELFAILGRIRVKQRMVAEEDVELLLSADDQLVAATSGPYGATTPAEVSSGALCTLTPAEFADLWSAANSDAARDALSLSLTIQIDASGAGLLAVIGPDVDVAVACTAMPC